MQNQTKIEKLLKKLPIQRKIDLSLSRINRLNKDLNINLEKLQNKTITCAGTNGKFSTLFFLRNIFEAAGYKIDLFTSPHISRYQERYVFGSKEISENELFELFVEVSKVNGSKPITIFEFLTAAFFYYSDKNSNSHVVLAENGLFNAADSVTSIGYHLQKILTACSLDHLNWLPAGKKTIDQVIVEKTKNINCSSIIVSKQSDNQILNKIKKNLKNNPAKQIIFSQNYSFVINKDGFLYKDEHGTIQLPKPKLLGKEHQIANFCCAIAAVRNLKRKFKITNEHIVQGITSIKTIKGRLSILDKGRLKQLAPSNTIIYDIASNPGAAKVTSKYLNTLDKNKKIYCIAGMLQNKIHDKFFSELAQTDISEILAIDIPNNNCIKKENLKKIIEKIGIKSRTSNSVQEAIKYVANKDKTSTILILGSIFLIGEVLNLN